MSVVMMKAHSLSCDRMLAEETALSRKHGGCREPSGAVDVNEIRIRRGNTLPAPRPDFLKAIPEYRHHPRLPSFVASSPTTPPAAPGRANPQSSAVLSSAKPADVSISSSAAVSNDLTATHDEEATTAENNSPSEPPQIPLSVAGEPVQSTPPVTTVDAAQTNSHAPDEKQIEPQSNKPEYQYDLHPMPPRRFDTAGMPGTHILDFKEDGAGATGDNTTKKRALDAGGDQIAKKRPRVDTSAAQDSSWAFDHTDFAGSAYIAASPPLSGYATASAAPYHPPTQSPYPAPPQASAPHPYPSGPLPTLVQPYTPQKGYSSPHTLSSYPPAMQASYASHARSQTGYPPYDQRPVYAQSPASPSQPHGVTYSPTHSSSSRGASSGPTLVDSSGVSPASKSTSPTVAPRTGRSRGARKVEDIEARPPEGAGTLNGPTTMQNSDAKAVVVPVANPNLRKRGKLPPQTTELLRRWLFDHSEHPYPSESEKRELCAATNLSMSQVSNWMINARRRILVPAAQAQKARCGVAHNYAPMSASAGFPTSPYSVALTASYPPPPAGYMPPTMYSPSSAGVAYSPSPPYSPYPPQAIYASQPVPYPMSAATAYGPPPPSAGVAYSPHSPYTRGDPRYAGETYYRYATSSPMDDGRSLMVGAPGMKRLATVTRRVQNATLIRGNLLARRLDVNLGIVMRASLMLSRPRRQGAVCQY
ncbi:hypothetical protein FISHEDRAFT_55275 [Fistulina hepatica ATCC 64428]|uniref:Homeobox domain-containing protein n=1 Tax=Fistulina hepatica ATCC 64428 TaxID=1128425 RepID=A0A0D7AMT1_9AGAR|nr:hypothetical protein FISHEDRAFT_55275 [Fistulina hepatica ATCC 64428]